MGFFPCIATMMFWNPKFHWTTSLLVNIPIFWLYFELIWNTVVTIQLEDGTLTICKPLRGLSLLNRKKHNQIVIRPDEWDQLFFRGYKDSTWFYFRKERTAAYFFTVDGISGLNIDLKLFFGDKTIERYEGYKPYVVKQLKKHFPERVL